LHLSWNQSPTDGIKRAERGSAGRRNHKNERAPAGRHRFHVMRMGKVAHLKRHCDTQMLMYSPEVQDHYKNPRNQGELPDATARVEVMNPVCGDTLQLAVRVENGRIAAARFKTHGCPPAIACSSLLTEMITGKTIEEVREITAEQISEALGVLPPATKHASQLAEDSLDALVDKL
jgi:nitrogen fixation NifU-like protein